MKEEVQMAREGISYTLRIKQGAIEVSDDITSLSMPQIVMRFLEEVDEPVLVNVHIHMVVVEVVMSHGERVYKGKHLSMINWIIRLDLDLARGR